MWKKLLWIFIPFAVMLLIGVGLLLRPYDEVEVVDVVETFSRQEKDNPRAFHTKTVYYAVVEVAYGDTTATVTVHDRTWTPLKPGDTVRVTRDLAGRVVEYHTGVARRLIACSAISIPLAALLFIIIYIRKRRDSGA